MTDQADIEKLLEKGTIVEEKEEIIEYLKPVDSTIKDKLHKMANLGFGAKQPCLITIELVREAINEWKIENQVYSQDISQNNCLELALSFRQILQISNLDNLVNLVTLRWDNNMIMKIEGLENLKNIKWLDLSFNYISEIAPDSLTSLKNLTDLSWYNNQIREVKNLDANREWNVLSIGRNEIKDVKVMVQYLRKFSKLQALCVHMNIFCKDDDSVQKILAQNQKAIVFPGSYDPIWSNWLALKYLDWKPIDEEYRKRVIDNSQNTQKDEAGGAESSEESRIKEIAALHNANLDGIIDFFDKYRKQVKNDIDKGINWDRLILIPGIKNQLSIIEKLINEDIEKYKITILQMQTEKDAEIEKKKKELEKNEEKFIEESKDMIKIFKRKFKSFVKELQAGNTPEVKTPEDSEKYVGLIKLKNDLLEIEIYAKQEFTLAIAAFKTAIQNKNGLMTTETELLKTSLDSKKNNLKDKINSIITDLRPKIEKYDDEKPEEGKENEQENVDPDNNLETLSKIFDLPDFNSDLEKVTEILDERIGWLKDQWENERKETTEIFFNNLSNEDYYRNKKRIQDIKEIYDIYFDKIRKEIDNFNWNKKN